MTELERDLERLFAADARARSLRAVAVAPRRRGVPFTALAAAGLVAALAFVAVLSFVGGPTERVAAPPALAPASPTPSPSPESCMDPLRLQPGEPIVGGSKLPGGAASEIRRVPVSGTEARWAILFVVGLQRDGGVALDVAPRATLRGPDGAVQIVGYEAGPDEAHTTATTATLRILPCNSAVLVVRTAAVRSGEYTLTLESVTSAGRTIAVPILAPLTCAPAGSGTQECVNTRGTRTTPVPSPTN